MYLIKLFLLATFDKLCDNRRVQYKIKEESKWENLNQVLYPSLEEQM